MFSREISSITLAGEVADELFGNITAANYDMDKTFVATLRAIVADRLPPDKTVNVALIPVGYTGLTAESIAHKIRQFDFGCSYSIYIVYPHDKSDGPQLLATARAHVNGYRLQEDLRIFYVRMLDGLFYTNDHSTVIFLDYLNIKRFHALQMMIPKYLPQLFVDNPLSPQETDLLKSLGSSNSVEYEVLIEQFAQQMDMRSEIIRRRLQGFETAYEQMTMRDIAHTIAILQEEYQTYLDNLRRTASRLQDQQIILAGLQCKIDGNGNESELLEYFLCNKQLSIVRVNGAELEFVVNSYADVFDEEAFNICAGNLNSYLYTRINESITKEAMQRLYQAIFEEGTYKLRVCAAYRVDMRHGITPLSNYIFPAESRTYFPNPHIQGYGCVGGYASRFMEYMHNRDYVGAIDQAAVSARNLNFYDSTVMSAFASNFSYTTIPCIEDKGGNIFTPMEVITCQSQSA